MIRTLILITASALALAACNSEDHTIVAGEQPDPMATELANAAPAVLPPAIRASKSYRCKDNSLLFVDWYADGSARVKKDRGEAGTAIAAPAEGATSPLTGAADTATISYNGLSCKG